jgi:hypothetical protein
LYEKQTSGQQGEAICKTRSKFGSVSLSVRESFEKADHPNLHLAVSGLLASDGWTSKLMGYIVPHAHEGVRFSHLLMPHYGTEASCKMLKSSH